MAGPAPSDRDPDLLNGWKEIAAYLGRSVRSVQRYERELKLPVRRLRTADGQTVYAFRSEVDAWRQVLDAASAPVEAVSVPGGIAPAPPGPSVEPEVRAIEAASPALDEPIRAGVPRPPRPSWSRLIVAAAVLAPLIGGALLLFVRHGHATPLVPNRFAINGQTLEARDSATGEVLWAHPFNRDVSMTEDRSSDLAPTIVDLDGDGRPVALVVVHFALRTGDYSTGSDVLYAFEASTGRVLWEVTPTLSLHCAGGQDVWSGPWILSALAVASDSPPRRIWAAFHQRTYWPGFVLEITPTGQSTLKYFQAGWVLGLTEWQTPSGPYLAAAGVDNEAGRASLALVDASGPPERMVTSDPRFACAEAPATAIARIFLFPTGDVTAALGSAYGLGGRVAQDGADLKAAIDAIGGRIDVIMTPDLHVKEFLFNDNYWVTHRELEAEGHLKHSAADCPDRTRPQPIQIWTPGTGWRTTTIVPAQRDAQPASARAGQGGR